MPLSLTAQAKLKAKDIFNRITLNRITTVVFLFTFIQCFSQALIHSFLFTVDVRYFNLLNGISEVANANAASGNFSYPPSTTGQVTLRMCSDVDLYDPMKKCQVIFDPARDIMPATNLSFDAGFRGQTILAIMGGEGGMLNRIDAIDNITSDTENALPRNSTLFDDHLYAVRITAADKREVVIGQQCVQILSYPKQHMQNAEREDLTWVFFQFWVFALTFCGLIWDSVPHLAAVICARTVNAAWSVYTIWRTLHQKSVFGQIVEQSGTPCSIEMFKQYFDQRFGFVVADAVLSVLSLAFGAYFSWHLIKVINTQAFKTVGAPEHVMKIYKFFHGLQVCLQLEVFVIAAALGLWADQWFNSYIASLSEHTTTYAAGFVSMAILLFPWLIVGWTAIRREMKKTTIFFLVISFILLFGWTVMFYSQLYRWTFLQWPYIGCFTTASIILLVISSTLGIICWRHYGEGLAQYLNAESALQSSNFTADRFEHDIEKSESFDPDAIVYELKRKVSASSSKSSRLSIGSFSAGVLPPMQPEPTFSLPTLSRNAPTATFQNVPLVDDPNRLAPLRRGSAF